jgi:hypothetical protein
VEFFKELKKLMKFLGNDLKFILATSNQSDIKGLIDLKFTLL